MASPSTPLRGVFSTAEVSSDPNTKPVVKPFPAIWTDESDETSAVENTPLRGVDGEAILDSLPKSQNKLSETERSIALPLQQFRSFRSFGSDKLTEIYPGNLIQTRGAREGTEWIKDGVKQSIYSYLLIFPIVRSLIHLSSRSEGRRHIGFLRRIY